jgi:hypothetical protein
LRSKAKPVKGRRQVRLVSEPGPPLIAAQLRQRYFEREMRRLGVSKIPLRLEKASLPSTVRERKIKGHLVDVVEISDELVGEAKRLAEKIQQHHSETAWKETFAGRDMAWETAGILGELAACIDLFGDWRKAKVLRALETSPDDSDFKFQERSIEVKTAGHEWHSFLLVPVPKFEKHHADAYVGAQVRGSREVWIWGYAAHDEVASAPVKNFGLGPSYSIPLRSLHPINELRDYLSREPSLLKYMTCVVSIENLDAFVKRYFSGQETWGCLCCQNEAPQQTT